MHSESGIFLCVSDKQVAHGGGFRECTRLNMREESVSTLLHSLSHVISINSSYESLLWKKGELFNY